MDQESRQDGNPYPPGCEFVFEASIRRRLQFLHQRTKPAAKRLVLLDAPRERVGKLEVVALLRPAPLLGNPPRPGRGVAVENEKEHGPLQQPLQVTVLSWCLSGSIHRVRRRGSSRPSRSRAQSANPYRQE